VLHYAIKHQLGTVISNSYGYPESEFGAATAQAFNHVIEKAAAQGINVDVSAGDSGDLGLGTPVGAASIPADSPYATAIGGTSLNVPSDNGPVESVWGITATYLADQNTVSVPADFLGFQQGSGGGESVYLHKPAWQSALPGKGRQLPDVAAVADPQTGVIIITPNSTGSESIEEVIGGTSLSSPVISGIWALAQEAANANLGQAAPIISTMPAGALTDIVPIAATAANNLSGKDWQGTTTNVYTASGLLNLTATQPTGFVGTIAKYGIGDYYDLGFGADSSLTAAIGWDDSTGYGVPNGLSFIDAAASTATK
jgi:subtilase family serine protease